MAKKPPKIEGDLIAPEVIEMAVQRADRLRGLNEEGKRSRGAARSSGPKHMHGVENENVHTGNESARQLDSRDEIERDSMPTSWKEPSRLAAPPPRSGYVNRFISLRTGSEEDADHFQEMIEEGWRPVKRSRVQRVHELTATTHGKYGQYYVKRGLILMELPEKLWKERDRYYKQRLADQNRGVDRNMFRLNNRYMPVLEPVRKTRTTLTARRGRLEGAIPDDEPGEGAEA